MITNHWSSNTSTFYFIQIFQCLIVYHVPKISTAGPLPPRQTVRTAYGGNKSPSLVRTRSCAWEVFGWTRFAKTSPESLTDCLSKNTAWLLAASLDEYKNGYIAKQGWVSSGRNLFLPGQRKKHRFFRIFPLSSGRNGRMGSMIRIEKAMGYE